MVISTEKVSDGTVRCTCCGSIMIEGETYIERKGVDDLEGIHAILCKPCFAEECDRHLDDVPGFAWELSMLVLGTVLVGVCAYFVMEVFNVLG